MDEKKYEPQKPMMYDIKEHEFACGKQNGRIQFIQISPNVTLQYCEIRQPHDVGPHRHDYEQIIFIPQGECDFWVDGVPYGNFNATLSSAASVTLCFSGMGTLLSSTT